MKRAACRSGKKTKNVVDDDDDGGYKEPTRFILV